MVPGERRQVLRAAVLGLPIAHSLSPVLHRAGYAAAGLTDWGYDAHEVDAAGLPAFVEALDDSWRGLSLTMPLKEAALSVATAVSDVATRAGAANTLVRRSYGAWEATNTDVVGIVRALGPHVGADHGGPSSSRRRDRPVRRPRARRAGPHDAHRARPRHREGGRPPRRALRPGLGIVNGSVAEIGPWVTTKDDVVGSTVPALAGEAVAATVPVSHTGVLLDVVYADWAIPLARAAAAAGMTVVPGLDMLVHQAAEQFTLFTGQPAPVEAMGAAGRAALGSR